MWRVSLKFQSLLTIGFCKIKVSFILLTSKQKSLDTITIRSKENENWTVKKLSIGHWWSVTDPPKDAISLTTHPDCVLGPRLLHSTPAAMVTAYGTGISKTIVSLLLLDVPSRVESPGFSSSLLTLPHSDLHDCLMLLKPVPPGFKHCQVWVWVWDTTLTASVPQTFVGWL